MASSGKIRMAPWTDDEVESLVGFQNDGRYHEFTDDDGVALVPTKAGWVHPKQPDVVVQNWAHCWMLDWAWKTALS
jgi:hypothetical protein